MVQSISISEAIQKLSRKEVRFYLNHEHYPYSIKLYDRQVLKEFLGGTESLEEVCRKKKVDVDILGFIIVNYIRKHSKAYADSIKDR